ncbi:MAG: YdeI/OmpD-associated family protein [Bacteroidia bacterium]|nr:YdeI/OmpD-associated family protein [Bacteroidia bacterium]
MPTDIRVDAFIKKAAPFAQPILEYLRLCVHEACPDVVENIKWGMPAFEYKGPYFYMASFKKHCAAGFYKSDLLIDKNKVLQPVKAHGGPAMGNLGRIESMQQLPPKKVIIDLLKQAKKLNDAGIKLPVQPKKPSPLKEIPADFKKLLQADLSVADNFKQMSPSQQREYLSWFTEAKTDATRNKRMQEAIVLIAQGKHRHWKYDKKYTR